MWIKINLYIKEIKLISKHNIPINLIGIVIVIDNETTKCKIGITGE